MDKATLFKQECIGLYSELHLGTLLEKMAAKICRYMGCEQAAMFLYDPIRETLSFEIATGDKKEELKKIVLKKGEGVVGWVAEHLKGDLINDCAKDPRFTAITDKKTQFRTRSLVAVPVKRADHFLGVLEVVNKVEGIFDKNDLDLMEEIGSFISIPLHNATLYKKIKSEVNEKERLIELGKAVSQSFDMESVFQSLRRIITDIIDPLEINVMVKSEGKTYRLLTNDQIPYEDADIDETTIDQKQAMFPLRVKDDMLGYLELKTRKKLPEETETLIRGVAIFAAISIEKYEMYKKKLENEKLEKEMEIARNIQGQFLPDIGIDVKGLDVSYINITSSRVGGDYYDIFQINNYETIFTMNDVAGHGLGASLLMAIFSANFKYRIKRDSMSVTIHHLNNLVAETTGMEQYLTSFTCCINPAEKKLSYINAGHPYPVLLRKEEVFELKEGETVLGLFADIPRSIHEISLEKDDILLLYTDGLIEAENNKEEQFSISKVTDFLMKNSHQPTLWLKENLIRELKRFTGMETFNDDITFIIIKVI